MMCIVMIGWMDTGVYSYQQTDFSGTHYYKDPNNSRGRNNSREWKIIQNLIKVGGGIIVGGGKNAEIKCRCRKK